MGRRWFLLGIVLYNIVAFTPASESVLAVGLTHAIAAAGLGAVGLAVLAMSNAEWERASGG